VFVSNDVSVSMSKYRLPEKEQEPRNASGAQVQSVKRNRLIYRKIE